MDDSWSAPYAIYTLGRVVRNVIWWMILRPAMLVAFVHVEGCKRQWTIDRRCRVMKMKQHGRKRGINRRGASEGHDDNKAETGRFLSD